MNILILFDSLHFSESSILKACISHFAFTSVHYAPPGDIIVQVE